MTAATTNGDRRLAAADQYRGSVAEGTPISAAKLGEQFDRSRSWGRAVISEVKAASNGNGGSQPAAIEPEVAAAGAQSWPPDPVQVSQITTPEPEVAATGQPEAAAETLPPWYDSAIRLVVALVAAAASYGHMYDVALMAGEPLWIARAFPITVDGLVLAALRRGEQGRWWLAAGLVISVAANVLAQYPEQAAAAGPVISAFPPLALYGTHRLLHGAPPGTRWHSPRSALLTTAPSDRKSKS